MISSISSKTSARHTGLSGPLGCSGAVLRPSSRATSAFMVLLPLQAVDDHVERERLKARRSHAIHGGSGHGLDRDIEVILGPVMDLQPSRCRQDGFAPQPQHHRFILKLARIPSPVEPAGPGYAHFAVLRSAGR